ncbi:MAG: hypothetical protein RTU92_09210 [Candidatus Thorarchaeota archaeon]
MNRFEVYRYLEADIYHAILSAFGKSTYEFEDALFYRLPTIPEGLLLSEDIFQEYLARMDELGYVRSCHFKGASCWRRLVAGVDVADYLVDAQTLPEALSLGKTGSPLSSEIDSA